MFARSIFVVGFLLLALSTVASAQQDTEEEEWDGSLPTHESIIAALERQEFFMPGEEEEDIATRREGEGRATVHSNDNAKKPSSLFEEGSEKKANTVDL